MSGKGPRDGGKRARSRPADGTPADGTPGRAAAASVRTPLGTLGTRTTHAGLSGQVT